MACGRGIEFVFSHRSTAVSTLIPYNIFVLMNLFGMIMAFLVRDQKFLCLLIFLGVVFLDSIVGVAIFKNRAEQMVYQSEKTLSDLGDKVDEADKAPVRDAIEKLKNTVKTDDLDAIKADTEALEKAFYPIAEKMYAAQGGAQADPNMGGAGQDGNTYYSADFEDKSDN